ncbi:thiamine phosphate synthase [Acidocella aminolytica]|jgi:thiamine-phosphate pyrophosphorylase|uniref:Thiamine phosphate pyrophosphorylase n=2 Tax=Acidocella TaxID=50709 RepID=A0A0D6PF65_9PROT|nr:thiamine phosphate synthase [Acidocella aminolytica]GAN80001.1 thiamine phosphate pyrophosphorylase [Acidocella aminolytica 101 = DSM 11237]
MDSRLIAWARAVKRRHAGPPPLWFFTDEARAPDPLSIIRRLPPGLCGVLLRHDSHPHRAALAKAAARLCRARRLALIIAGDAKLAARLQAGVHLRGGQGGRPTGWHGGLVSASVHNEAQMRRARRAGAELVFISPVFPTASHPGAVVLGGAGWRRLARQAGRIKPYALGGINGVNMKRTGLLCAGIGAIDAFL